MPASQQPLLQTMHPPNVSRQRHSGDAACNNNVVKGLRQAGGRFTMAAARSRATLMLGQMWSLPRSWQKPLCSSTL